MILYPNAKINLGLNVVGKRDNGYHEISSVFYPVESLFDVLEIIPSDVFSFNSSGIDIPGEINICQEAFNLLNTDFNITPVKIHLEKKIPIGAGLGGGSADGAFTLLALNKIFNLQLSNIQLKTYALKLGADCPFFIDNTPQYVTGIGEKMHSINLDLSSFELKFFFPDLHVSTLEAYSNIKISNADVSLLELIKQPVDSWKGRLKNDFETSIFLKYPLLNRIKNQFYSDGAIYASMTGSGSVIYALFRK